MTVHSLAWLVAGNAVGLWLASLLLVPRLGTPLGSLSYGRWATVHLDVQLYGWCALPLLGGLLVWTLPRGSGRRVWLAVNGWSAAVALGVVTWLTGSSSGKLFLDWRSAARSAFLTMLVVLAMLLASGLWGRSDLGKSELVLRGAVLLALLAVPWAMALATRRDVYPPVDPDSGGPTGVSLLGSALGLVWIAVLLPRALGLGRRPGGGALLWGALAGHSALFGLLEGARESLPRGFEVAALLSLLPWAGLLVTELGRFSWPVCCDPLRRAFGGWWSLLVISAVATGMPPILDRLKFTNALVAHAHLAMGGAVSALCLLLLAAIDGTGGLAERLARRRPLWLWNSGLSLQVAALTAVGLLEARDPGAAILRRGAVDLLYGLRWAGGAAMLGASVSWLGAALDGQGATVGA